MKKVFTFFLLLLSIAATARQMHTIQSGNWEDSTVWSNAAVPDTVGDTISIYHHINLHHDLVLSSGCYLFIDSTGWLCGDYSLLMHGYSHLLNLGFLGVYYFELYFADVINRIPGIVDVGEAGIKLEGIGFTRYFNDRGCTRVHLGRQICRCLIDTFFVATTVNELGNFITHGGAYYEYDFGDGTSLDTSAAHVSHIYTQSGEFVVRLIIHDCCQSDTVYRLLRIEIPPPPPPPCVNTTPYRIYPNPTDSGFWLENEYCDEEEVKVKIYTIAGQLTDTYTFSTSEKKLKEYISCYWLSAATYIVDIQSAAKSEKLRLVIVDDDY